MISLNYSTVTPLRLLLSVSVISTTVATMAHAVVNETTESNEMMLDMFPSAASNPEDCNEEFVDLIEYTNYNYPNEEMRHKKLGTKEYLNVTLYVVVMLAALFGNVAVVISVMSKHSLRVTVNLYLANLAVVDILICVCCMLVHMINHLTEPAYVLGPLICKFNGFAQMTCLTSSVLTLSAISCDRYMAIMFPLRSRVTKQRTDAVICAIWIFSFLISIPFLIYRRLRTIEWKDYTETTCMEVWPLTSVYSPELKECVRHHHLKKVYYTLVTSTLFFVPVFIMLTAYSAIIWKLWVNKVPGEANYANIKHQKKSKRKVIQMVVVVLLVFVICWLPLQMVVLYSLYFRSTNEALPGWFPKLSFYSTFIAYSNSAFNPLIYGGFNKNFRDALCNNSCCRRFICWRTSQWKRGQISLKSMSTTMSTVRESTKRNGMGRQLTSGQRVTRHASGSKNQPEDFEMNMIDDGNTGVVFV